MGCVCKLLHSQKLLSCKTGRILFSVFFMALQRVKMEISPCFGYEQHATWATHTWKWKGCNIIKAIIYEQGEGITGLEKEAKKIRNRVYAREWTRRGWKERRGSFHTNDIFYNLNPISQSFCQWWMAAIKRGIVAVISRTKAKSGCWWGAFIIIPDSPARGQGLRSQYCHRLWV